MHTRVKGNIARQKVIKYMEERGFETGIVERTGRFIFPKDLFNIFDLFSCGSFNIFLIQVASNKPHTHKKFIEFIKKHPCLDGDVFQFVWKDRKGFKIFQYHINDYNEVDEICAEE